MQKQKGQQCVISKGRVGLTELVDNDSVWHLSKPPENSHAHKPFTPTIQSAQQTALLRCDEHETRALSCETGFLWIAPSLACTLAAPRPKTHQNVINPTRIALLRLAGPHLPELQPLVAAGSQNYIVFLCEIERKGERERESIAR